MRPRKVLANSRALWNREGLELSSDEVLAQILDRGSLMDWRALYELMTGEGDEARRLRERVHSILFTVPTGRPRFWLAALTSLGHPVDWSREPKQDRGEADI
jgi:hypothetical protein